MAVATKELYRKSIYHLFLHFLFWTCMSEIKCRPYIVAADKCEAQHFFFLITQFYVDILSTYQKAKLK